jgi:hypothetical protein
MKEPFCVWFSHIGEEITLSWDSSDDAHSNGKHWKAEGVNEKTLYEPVEDKGNCGHSGQAKYQIVSHPCSETFGWLLENVNENMDRHVVISYRIEDCSALYDLFIRKGKKKHDQMYHSRTLARIQDSEGHG